MVSIGLLRTATPADLPEIVAVQESGSVAALAHIFPQDRHPFPRQAIHDRWASEIANPAVDVFVAVSRQDRVEGFAAVRGNQLLHFGVAVPVWGTGLAAAVHAELVTHLARSGEPTAWLRVFEANGRARRFYEKTGWAPTGRRTRSSFPPHPVLVEYERMVP